MESAARLEIAVTVLCLTSRLGVAVIAIALAALIAHGCAKDALDIIGPGTAPAAP